MRDKLWFFTDGRYQNNKQQRVLDYTLLSYPWAQSDKRYEGKGTYAINSQNTLKASYTQEVDLDDEQHVQQPDGPRQPVQQRHDRHADGGQLHERAVTSKLFLEGQFSRKTMTTDDTGRAVHRTW